MKFKIFCLALISGWVVSACQTDEGPAVDKDPNDVTPTDNIITYMGTQSPGDVWVWNLNYEEGTMTAVWDYGTFDDASDDIAIEGTFETLPSGFIKVTIVGAEPPSAEVPTDGSAWFYAIELPDMALLVKPEGSIKGDLIAMVAQGDCNAIPGTYNYIITAPGGRTSYNPIVDEAFGYMEATSVGVDFAISGFKFSLDCVNGGNCSETGPITGMPIASCGGNGRVDITENGQTQAQGQFTNAGVMMMDFGYGNGGVFALKADENATKASLVGNAYNGLAYLPKKQNDPTLPVRVDFFVNDLGTLLGTGYAYTSLENSIVNNEESIVIVVEDVINGRVLGHTNFNHDATVSEMAAALLVKGNKQILVLSTYDEESHDPIILVLTKSN
jgi:hypothetical protein